LGRLRGISSFGRKIALICGKNPEYFRTTIMRNVREIMRHISEDEFVEMVLKAFNEKKE